MISDEKQRLRAEMRRRVRAMAPDERGERSARIAEHIVRELAAAPDAVLGFAPMASEPEWYSPRMVDWVIALPRVVEGGLEFHRVLHWDGLVAGRMGNREPEVEEGSLMRTGNVALVPGLAFDVKGGRLGRGGGYYDRFLAGFGGRTVGVCFACQLVNAVPREPHDAALDAVVTENGWIFPGGDGERI